jgi:MraZ protein
MLNLQGEYVVSIDPKGRVRLPAALLKQFDVQVNEGEEAPAVQFVMNHWFENRLMLWPIETWNEMMKMVRKLNTFNKKQRELQRMFLSGTQPITTDSAGRILIGKKLLEYAKIESELVMTCQFNRIEISPASVLETPLNADLYEELGQEVFGGENNALVFENEPIDMSGVFGSGEKKPDFDDIFGYGDDDEEEDDEIAKLLN